MTFTADQLQANLKAQQLKFIALSNAVTKIKKQITTINNALVDPGDPWQFFGAMSNSWSNSHARYKLLGVGNLIIVELQLVVPGTPHSDGTVIWSAANGLASGYQPDWPKRLPCYSDNTGTEAPAFEFETDGSVKCYGFGGTTSVRGDGTFIFATT